jgi:hypothetical protein
MDASARLGVTVIICNMQRPWLYSGVRMLTWFYLSSMNIIFFLKGSEFDLCHLYLICPLVQTTGSSSSRLLIFCFYGHMLYAWLSPLFFSPPLITLIQIPA